MRLIRNGEPAVFEHFCSASEKGKIMNDLEKRDFLVEDLLNTYKLCGMKVRLCEKPRQSFFAKLFGKKSNAFFPDIEIEDFMQSKGKRAYYIVLPKGTDISNLDVSSFPEHIRNSYVKVIFGSVFCLEEQKPELYKKGSHFVAQYISKAITPIQKNEPLPKIFTDKELAEIFADAWQNLDTSQLKQVLDKDFHYSNDSVFDDMASREEYLDYLNGKFKTLRRTLSIKRVQLGRNGENGDWATIVKQIQTDGTPIVCGFFIKSSNGRIKSVEIREMDLPNF